MNKNKVIVRNLRSQAVIADKCQVAGSFLSRLQGLIGKSRFEAGEGMLFPKCNDIHMWFMSIPIDVVFLRPEGSGNFVVTSAHSDVKPWKLLPLRDGSASDTLELPAGTVRLHSIATGDVLTCTS